MGFEQENGRVETEAKRMWPGGPLRRFSPDKRFASSIALESGGYAGAYICDGCGKAHEGIYGPSPSGCFCSGCRDSVHKTPPAGDLVEVAG